ncbi:MAG: MG2 domain-containing protein, partial [Akkermansiaceae bacterium]|nr:MG2 domain-containing protein [Akkermansiaceae bacterium]
MTKYLTPLLLLFFFTAPVFAGPRLVLSTPDLAPESQIDFVFDLPMVPTSELGKVQENSFVVIQPELHGTLTWKAQNIAQLTLTQAPRIATRYTFSIPAGRNHLDQSPVPVGKFATASSEAFRVMTARTGNRWVLDYSPATSPWTLAFNDAVDLTIVAPFIEFVSGSGQRVAAKVEFPAVQEGGSSGWVRQFGAWASRFPNSQSPLVLPDQTMPNVIEASPVSPLPVGDGWTLCVYKGLPNRSASAVITEVLTYSIGDVKPFKVTEIHSRVQMDQPREVLIKFSQSLPKTLPDDFVRTCIEISPNAENLHAEVDGDSIVLSGNFIQSNYYRVGVKPPLVSRAGIRLEGEFAKKIKFEHFMPQVAFPSEDNGQLSSGSRQYRMLTLNLASAHVRVKKLTGLDLIRAFQGYRNFTGKGPDRESIEPTAPIPFGLVLGQLVMEREIPLSNPLDTSKMVTFDWDEDLPKGMRCGEFFVEAAGKGAGGCGGPLRPTAQALVQLTDIGLAWKLTEKEAMVYAFSCNTGAPLPKVKLQLYGEEATALQAAVTDASGLATLPRSALARHLHATLGDDSYITAFDSTLETVGLWHFPIRYSWNKAPTRSRQAFLFTDRSVYRPGETMHLKGMVRMQNGNAIEAAESGSARVVIMDPTEKEIHTSPVTLSASGSFDLTYTLPQGQTGSHMIRFEYPEEIARAEASADWSVREPLMDSAHFEIPLRVEEFRRNAFEIAQVLAEPPIGSVRISSELTASYYQGQPVAAGKVSYFSRITAKNPYPERFRDFLFGNHRTDDWGYWYHYFGYNSDAGEAAHPDQFKGELPLGADGKAK